MVKVVKESSSSGRVEPKQSVPSREEKGKAASRSVSFALDTEVDSDEEEEDVDEFDAIQSAGDDYVSHGLYREIIAEGFDKRSPSRLAPNKPAYFPIDDPVTRTLHASKYSAKAQEYAITVANAFFTSVTRAALDDAIAAFGTPGSDPGTVLTLLS